MKRTKKLSKFECNLISASTNNHPGVQEASYGSVEEYKGFQFRYCHDNQSPGKVQVFVERQPSYGSRDTHPRVIHRWPPGHIDSREPAYICFKEEAKPSGFESAQKFAHAWADMTEKYIRTGETIDQQISRRG
jgi:hypothetical protein